MDQRRFDDLTRLLGASGTRRGGLRAALGGLLGVGVGAAALDADADARGRGKDRNRDADADRRKRRKRCTPACAPGQTCRKGTCVCDNGGTVCGAACCLIGQACQGGQCVTLPEPGQCIPAGEPCKGVGRPCCDGRTCSSGQGGETDVACYVHKTGACQSTADCVYMTSCVDGRCALDVPPPAPLAEPCDPSLGQGCDVPGATCAAYDGAGAPAGSFCTLPLNYACTGDADCTCYHCGWVAGDAAATSRRAARAGSGPRLACCGPAGFGCASDRNCCLGNVCVGGTCQPETTCDVCKTGGCPYQTVGAAVAAMPAGSTIRVAPDVYTVDQTINVGKTLTIRPCGAADGVVLESDGTGIISMWPDAGAYTLAVIGTEFRAAAGASYQPTGIAAYGTDSARATLQVANCAFRNVRPGIQTGNHADITVTGSTFDGSTRSLVSVGKNAFGGTTFAATGCTFRNATESAIYVGNVDTTLTDCVITGGGGYLYNQKTVGGAIFFLAQGTTAGTGSPPIRATLTLAGSTRVSGATATDSGGGVAIVTTDGAVASLAMTGTSRIDGNAITGPGTPTPNGSGLVYFMTNPNGNFTGSGVTGRVTGNTGGADQCALYVYGDGSGSNYGFYVPAPNCLPPAICLENAQFCSAFSNACCAGNVCDTVTVGLPEPRCCLAVGATCTVNQVCCDTAGDRATCQSGTCQACLAQGVSCSSAIDCCSKNCQGTCQ